MIWVLDKQYTFSLNKFSFVDVKVYYNVHTGESKVTKHLKYK